MSSIKIKDLIKNCKKTDLLKELIWPAAAGNVAWTFFSVLLTILQPNTEEAPFARLIAILLLACYLGIVYLMPCEEAKDDSKQTRSIFDILHSLTIIFCAISFQLNFDAIFYNICLSIFWGIAALGHLAGAWIPDSIAEPKFRKQILMSLISIIGLGLCWTFSFIQNDWNLVISLFIGLILWVLLRHCIYK